MAGGPSNMTNDVFLAALVEAAYMWPFVCGTVRACCTVLVMCPTMGLVASDTL